MIVMLLAASVTAFGAVMGLAALNPPGMPWVLAAVLVPYWLACSAIPRISRPRGESPPAPRGRVYLPRTGAAFAGHIHSGAGPCPQCLATLGMLTGLAGLVAEMVMTPDEAAERVATTGEVSGAGLLAQALQWIAAIDDEATAYMAAWDAQAAEVRRALGAPLATVAPCGAMLDRHLCRERTPGTHTHLCRCGTSWGVIV